MSVALPVPGAGVAAGAGAAASAVAVAGTVALYVKLKKSALQYNRANVEEFESIVSKYERFIGPTLPEEFLKVPDKEPAIPSLHRDTLEEEYWRSQLEQRSVGGPWKAVAMNAVRTVLQYVHNANTNQLFHPDYSLPRHFFLHELLTWVVFSLGTFQGVNPTEERRLAETRMLYLEALERSDSIRNKKYLIWEREITMRMVLLHVSGMLRWTVMPELVLLGERLSVSDRLRSIINLLRGDVIDQALKYLYRVVNSETPTNQLIVADVVNDAGRFQKTGSFLCLQHLCQADAIGTLYRTEYRLDIRPKDEANPFFEKAGPRIPAGVLVKKPVKDKGLDQRGQLFAFFQSNGGVFDEFLRVGEGCAPGEHILEQFVLLHGLTLEASRFLYFLNKIVNLSNLGGDLLIYAVVNGRVGEHLSALQSLLQKMQQAITSIELCTRDHYERRIKKRMDPGSWDYNYRDSGAGALLRSIGKLFRAVSKVRTSCETISLQEIVRRVTEAVGDYWQESDRHLDDLAKLGVHARAHVGEAALLQPPALLVGLPRGNEMPEFRILERADGGMLLQNGPGSVGLSGVMNEAGVLSKMFKCNECGHEWRGVKGKRAPISFAAKLGRCSECRSPTARVDKLYVCAAGHQVRAERGTATCPHCAVQSDVAGRRPISMARPKSRKILGRKLLAAAEAVPITLRDRLLGLPTTRHVVLLSPGSLIAGIGVLLTRETDDERSAWLGSARERLTALKGDRRAQSLELGAIASRLPAVETIRAVGGADALPTSFEFKNFAVPLQFMKEIIMAQEKVAWRVDELSFYADDSCKLDLPGDNVALFLAKQLHALPYFALQSLSLMRCGLTDFVVLELLETLRTRPGLRELALSDNPTLTKEAINAVCGSAAAIGLCALRLARCGLTAECGESIAGLVSDCAALRTLELSGNPTLREEAFFAILRAIDGLSPERELVLGFRSCDISRVVGERIASVWRDRPALYVELEGNDDTLPLLEVMVPLGRRYMSSAWVTVWSENNQRICSVYAQVYKSVFDAASLIVTGRFALRSLVGGAEISDATPVPSSGNVDVVLLSQ